MGIIQYYSFVYNLNSLSAGFHFRLISSCTKLLAAKFTLDSQAAVYKKSSEYCEAR